jgi:hypothetical protein
LLLNTDMYTTFLREFLMGGTQTVQVCMLVVSTAIDNEQVG